MIAIHLKKKTSYYLFRNLKYGSMTIFQKTYQRLNFKKNNIPIGSNKLTNENTGHFSKPWCVFH